MPLNKINHYSMNNPASVYDEEALTALELSARTAKKVNDCVEAYNKLEEDTQDTLTKYDVKLSKFENDNIPNGIIDFVNTGDIPVVAIACLAIACVAGISFITVRKVKATK